MCKNFECEMVFLQKNHFTLKIFTHSLILPLFFASYKRGKDADGRDNSTDNKCRLESRVESMLEHTELSTVGMCHNHISGSSTTQASKNSTDHSNAQALSHSASSGQEARGAALQVTWS